ncbi:MAG: hypothetical protein NW224_01105 [Leptolyngbyaceae cyanobacterium bins.302]|nr:hypothetical protein [Leptolyngbyaceae cyanobacterium bins.302]
MKRLLEQLDAIKSILDTVTPAQLETDPEAVESGYEVYAQAYNPIERVKDLKDRLISEIRKGRPVNGYLSAGYGYGKTATLVYLWHECQKKQIAAVPPFKFREIGDLMIASYGWMKKCLSHSRPDLIAQVDKLYQTYGLKSQEAIAARIAKEDNISESKALKIVSRLVNYQQAINADSLLSFWRESVPVLKEAGFVGLAVFADESQEFVRTEEGSSARIQILSDLIKGMRGMGATPVALILSMPTDPTESVIEEQAGDIIHRMQEQKVSLRLADAYNHEFPTQLWDYLCEEFLDDKSQGDEIAHPATLESLGQLCDRKDLSNGPRAVIEVFKRMVHFAQDNKRPYTPLDLIDDYLLGWIGLYGTEQHRIGNTINTLELIDTVKKQSRGRDVIKLLSIFPAGVSREIAKEFGLEKDLKRLAEDGNLIGQHITCPQDGYYALVSLNERQTNLTALDEILNRFRQRWFGSWSDQEKATTATQIFKTEVLPLLLPPSKAGQKANWTWRYKETWKETPHGSYNFLTGAPERHYGEFPNRSLIVSVGTNASKLMQFQSPEETHLDWRFHLSYDREQLKGQQRIRAIGGMGQLDFHLELGRTFQKEYPTAFGLLRKVMAPDKCSAATLLTLVAYIQGWLNDHPEASRADQQRLEQHQRECLRYSLQLLLPEFDSENWLAEGIKGLEGTEVRLLESIFEHQCRQLFPEYLSFANSRTTLKTYELALRKVPLAARRGRQPYQALKEEFEELFKIGGSALPNLLSTLKKCHLIENESIAGRREDLSCVEFTEHPLEEFVRGYLERKGHNQLIKTHQGNEEVKALDYQELWKEAKRQGYLEDEFEEALGWAEARRYIEWDRQRGTIRQAVAELDPDDLEGQLLEIRDQVVQLAQIFGETELAEINTQLAQARKNLDENRHDEVALDLVQRSLQSCRDRIEGLCSGRRSSLQQELKQLRQELDNFTRDFNLVKVGELILGSSGLEPTLNDYRKQLEKRISKLERDCKNLASKLKLDETDLLALNTQLKQVKQSQKKFTAEKAELQPLVSGLEQWRIIVSRAGGLRDGLSVDPDRLRRYDDDFLDRVVIHFAKNQVDGFKQWELLKAPLDQLEQEISSERRSRRDKFDQLRSQYETLVGRVDSAGRHLQDCRFDDEDIEGSYESLRRVVLQKLENWCSSKSQEWKNLERDLAFQAQEREEDVTDLLNQIEALQAELNTENQALPVAVLNLDELEQRISKLIELQQDGAGIRKELNKLQFQKGELTNEEKTVLETLRPGESSVTISQLRQRVSSTKDVLWTKLKNLYKKGHIEIILRRRD